MMQKSSHIIKKSNNNINNISEQVIKNDGYWLDIIICIIFIILGFFSRFYNLEHPSEVVFDEQHFGKFVNWYIKGEYFLDIHPPLGKLLLMISGLLLGYNENTDYDNISEPFPDRSYMSLRFLPALFGSLLIPLCFICMRVMGLSRSCACLVAWLVLVENIVITESRYILCDSFLFFFIICSLICSFKANNEEIFSFSWILWLFLCGISMGFTISIKFTGLGLIGTIGVHQFIILFINYDRKYSVIFKDIFLRLLLLLLPMIIIFISLFIIHILLLPYPGDGDGFMSHEFRARLIQKNGLKQVGYEHIEPLGLFDSVFELISTMHEVNINLRASHPFQSYWYQWVIIQCKSVLYWQKLRAGYGMWIYCVGNAASWLFSATFGIIGFILISLIGGYIRFLIAFNPLILETKPNSFLTCFNNTLERYWWCTFLIFVGYCGNYLPFVLIPRAVWNYHYIPALLFSYMLCGLNAQILLDTAKKYNIIWFSLLKCIFIIVIMATTGCFLYLSPWTYALPMSDLLNSDRFLFDSWKFTY